MAALARHSLSSSQLERFPALNSGPAGQAPVFGNRQNNAVHCTMSTSYNRMPLYLKWLRGIKYAPVSIEFERPGVILSQTLLIQGHNISPCSVYRGIKERKSQI